ncbi:hypothetical protein Taro_046537 [Colocasia esculenta]|uniref:Germin-like protein n=1 Tax=Colocasia esculenta TaxID=4460 RepID=A0A843X5P8_COLES|nr:hypothetical protein [Colocasia esculenta]
MVQTIPSFVLSLLLLLGAAGADPDLLVDFCVANTSAAQDFFFNGVPCIDPAEARGSHFTTSALSTPGNTSANPFGFSGTITDVSVLPGGNGQGLTILREDFAPQGVLPLHTHPRSSEAVMVLQGELLVGFIDTANRMFAQRLRPMEVFMFPRGLIHFQYNPNPSSPALAIAVFNSQNPGAQLVISTFVSNPPMDIEPLKKSYQISEEEVQTIRKNLGA